MPSRSSILHVSFQRDPNLGEIMSVQELEAEVLNLPSHERARLAEVLIASLDEEDEIGQAWIDEAERRYEELHSGKVKGIPAEEVFARVRSHLQ